MTSAWQYPVHSHPWFRMPTHKRKALEREDSSSSDYSDFERYVHPPKRLKYGILESGLAQLSLDTAVQVPIVTEPYLPSSSSESTFAYGLPTASQSASNAASLSSGGIAWDGSIYDVAQADPKRTQSVVLPGSVEEPTSPEAPRAQEDLLDVRMKSRSWYEPEKDRIVVVDLDDSDVEDSAEDQSRTTVSAAALNWVNSHGELRLMSSSEPCSSMALVPYLPPLIPDARRDTREEDFNNMVQSSRSRIMDKSVVNSDVDLVDNIDNESCPMDVDDAMDIEY